MRDTNNTRVYSQVARKDYPDQKIERGDVYYRWSLRDKGPRGRGKWYLSPTYPKPWQLTSSSFLQQLYILEDQVTNAEDRHDDLEAFRRDKGEP